MNKNRKTSHILNVFQFDANGHVILPATLTIGENPHSSDNTSKIPSTAWIRTYVTGLSYLTGNQSITVSGDATGSGTTAITLTLANTAVTPGTYGSTTLVPVVTVDSKGRITSVTTAAISGSLTFTGDVTGTGTTGTSTGLTLAASGVTAGTYTKVTVDSKGRVTVGANASTTDISEGTNLYYTDTRVGTYLTANSYATQSYVGTQIANLVASAPATLDTLNELSVALGNDPNFATSVATSIGTKQAQLNGTGFVKVIGTTVSYDNNTYLTSFTETDPIYVASTWYSTTNNATNWNTAYGWGNHAIVGYLTSVPTHNQAWSTITSTPTTISGYGITNAYTDAQIQNFFNGANAITGYNKSNWDTAYGWGNHASGGYLTGITSSQVTTALGYTPYNSTNPSGYITGITSSNVTTALGYTPYNSTNPSGYITGITSGNVTTALGFTPLSSSGSVTINGDLTVGVGNSSNIYMNDGDEGQRQIHCNSNRIGFLTQAGAWGAYCDDSGNWFANNLSGTNTGDQTNISGTAGSISGFNNPTAAATANTIAYRDGSGDLYARYFLGGYINTTDNVDTGTITHIMAKFGDNYHRSATAAKVQSFLGLGSLAYSSATIPTNNNQLTNGAGYITSYSETDTLGSVTNRGSSTSQNIVFSNGRKGLVGVYDAAQTQAIFAMGAAYILTDGGASSTIGNLYGLAWSYNPDYGGAGNNPQSKAGLNHQLLLMQNGVTTAAMGSGIWTSGNISAANFSGSHSGSSSGTNTGDQTNISGNAATATAAAGVSFLTQPNSTWAGRLQLGGNGANSGVANIAVVQATDGNLHMDGGVGKAMYLNYYSNGIIYLNGSTYYISANGSQYNGNAATATSAGSAPNASNANAYYNVTPGTGYGLKFWSSDAYKISMGASALYYYGPVTDYSIKMQMDDGSAGRGFTWGRESYAPIAGLNGTSGNMQIAGTFTSTAHYITGSTNGGYIYSNDWGIKMANNNGYIQFGPANASWSHIYSDKSFYFNQELYVNGQQVIHSGNIGSQSVSSAGTVTGSSTISGYLTVSTNWGVSPYTAAFNIVGTHPSMVFRGSNGDTHYLIHMDSAGDIQYYFGPGYLTNNWVQRYTFSKGGDFTLRSGSLVASGDITAFSDARVKTNIQTIENALNKTLTLRGVTYTRTDSDDKKTKIGVIAQETLPIVPEVVNQDSAGMYNVSYGNITALLIEAIKEQQLQIEELKNKLDELTK